jgi:hypothetical protein
MSATKTRKNTGISAWLVTWEHTGEHAKPHPDTVAAILSPRLSARRVLETVELLYANESYDPSERIAIAKTRRENPYPARFGVFHGVPWQGEITCGHNPWLEAHLVTNLRAETDAAGREEFAWDERPKPSNALLAGRRGS